MGHFNNKEIALAIYVDYFKKLFNTIVTEFGVGHLSLH